MQFNESKNLLDIQFKDPFSFQNTKKILIQRFVNKLPFSWIINDWHIDSFLTVSVPNFAFYRIARSQRRPNYNNLKKNTKRTKAICETVTFSKVKFFYDESNQSVHFNNVRRKQHFENFKWILKLKFDFADY